MQRSPTLSESRRRRSDRKAREWLVAHHGRLVRRDYYWECHVLDSATTGKTGPDAIRNLRDLLEEDILNSSDCA